MIVEERYHLPAPLLEELRERPVNWGFGALSEAVYYRTYSRDMDGKQEMWPDTVARVVEGVMSIRQDWYRNVIGKRWDLKKADVTASELARAIFEMKMLPPGRGLWAMGTEYVYERGSMALNNCGAVEVKTSLADASRWLMDSLMCGVGVGFTTNTASLKVRGMPRGEAKIYVIPDTKEGWAESVRLLIDAYERGSRPVEFDYSVIRPKGAPIRGFGGISSGPAPLKKLHTRVRKYMNEYVEKGKKHPTRLIADVMNAIGACVVSGNVRRSAELAVGAGYDAEFLGLKDYTMNPDRAEIGWMSNNSIALNDREDFGYLPDLSTRIQDNGEPGIINMLNIKKYGRMGERHHDDAIAVNPCVTGDTLVAVADGRGAVRIDELAMNGDDVPVYALNEKTGKMEVKMAVAPRWTGHRQVVKVTLDNDTTFRTTPDHKFILRGGTSKKASDLAPGDSLIPFTRWKAKAPDKKSWYWHINGGRWRSNRAEHRLIAEYVGATEKGTVIHHRDFDSLNNDWDNLIQVTPAQHMQLHRPHMLGKNNPIYRMSDEVRVGWSKKQSEQTTRRNRLRKHAPVELTCEVCGNMFEVPYIKRMLRVCSIACRNGLRKRLEERTCEKCGVTFEINPNSKQRFCSLQCGRYGGKDAIVECLWCGENFMGPSRRKYCTRSHAAQHRVALKRGDPTTVNHQVVSIEFEGMEDVYNLTVDDHHNFAMVDWVDGEKLQGVMSRQCGEIPLESFELCNLAETFPTRCNGDLGKIFELGTFYASTVSLLRSHSQETNEVVSRNRRIGVSASGIADWLDGTSVSNVFGALNAGYDIVRATNRKLAKDAGVAESIRVTTVKPSGTVSLLAGVSSGMHFPIGGHALRRVRISSVSPVAELLTKAGIPNEPDEVSEHTTVFEFPLQYGKGKTRAAKHVSVFEQAAIVAMLQRCWADNAVSNTLSVQPDEMKQVERVLSLFAPQVKSLSMMPDRPNVYPQMPVEHLRKGEFEELSSKIGPVDWSSLHGSDGDAADSSYCTTDACEIPQPV